MSNSLQQKGEGENGNKTPLYFELAHLKFALSMPEQANNSEIKNKLLKAIVENNMAPYYQTVCNDLGWTMDENLLKDMVTVNEEKLLKLGNESTTSVHSKDEDEPELWQKQLHYYCSIGDVEAGQQLGNSILSKKTLSTYCRLDVIFTMFRLAYLNNCNLRGMKKAIGEATELLDDRNCCAGGDWSARNKLKAYEALWCLAIRDYSHAASLLVDVTPTFESYELISFASVMKYSILTCMIALSRAEMKEKLTHGDIAQSLSQHPDLKEFFISFYDGRYSDFFLILAKVERDMKLDPLMHRHYHHYVREMKLRAYSQLLQAYRSLSLQHMAKSFGVTADFIEKEVAHFAAAGRLSCKIDRVAGTVVSSNYTSGEFALSGASDANHNRGLLYQNTIKWGDNLLNRLKKLARVMDF